jgi:hypothetical protein
MALREALLRWARIMLWISAGRLRRGLVKFWACLEAWVVTGVEADVDERLAVSVVLGVLAKLQELAWLWSWSLVSNHLFKEVGTEEEHAKSMRKGEEGRLR